MAGSAFLEELLILPVVLLMFWGFVSVGRYVLLSQALANTVQNGVVQWAQGSTPAQVQAFVQRTAQKEGVVEGPIVLTFQQQGSQVTLTANMPFHWIRPVASSVIVIRRTAWRETGGKVNKNPGSWW
ncbi:MAG: pilus assembly protein [Firmicutes bacterium]|nr:pilus assembly protein [Bacillota bacterium]